MLSCSFVVKMVFLRLSILFIIFNVCLVVAEVKPDDVATPDRVLGSLTQKNHPGDTERNIPEEMNTFKKFVYRRHAERLQAVNNVMKLNDYAKQFEMLDIVFSKLLEVLLKNRVILESSGFIPGEDWPLNRTVRDAMAEVIENTLFFGEFVLRLPEISRKVLKYKKEWKTLVTWTWSFSRQCLPYLHEKQHIPLNLMAQELEIIDKDESFYNQFKMDGKFMEEPSGFKVPEKKKRTKEKGPRMSSASAGEL